MSTQPFLDNNKLFPAQTDGPSGAVYIGLLFQDEEIEAFLFEQLEPLVKYLPVVSLSGKISTIEKYPGNEVFLLTDWDIAKLEDENEQHQFALIVFVREEEQVDERFDNVIVMALDEQTGEKVAVEIMSRLFPGYDESRLMLESQNRQQLQFLEHIGKELSTFYHNINNPLTVLSGNIQFLQMLTNTMNISADLMKPITDIATISSRFEQDLKSIQHLKEKIKSGTLKAGSV